MCKCVKFLDRVSTWGLGQPVLGAWPPRGPPKLKKKRRVVPKLTKFVGRLELAKLGGGGF